MEKLDKLFNEMKVKDDAYFKAEMELRNSCIKLLKELPFDYKSFTRGEWRFSEGYEPIVSTERNIDWYCVRGVSIATDTISFIGEDEELMMPNELNVDDLFLVARMARNEITRED